MKTLRRSRIVSVDRMFRAFSDRTRLRILHLLLPGELCVCHIVDVLDLPQPKVSRHLAYLRRTGLVLARKEGLWNYYRLAPAQS
jgi:ArsR family transcriptional regulator, arsenate/arsenite/antimonite-responsive transcriptional repressor